MPDPFESRPRREFWGVRYQSRQTSRLFMGMVVLGLGIIFMLDNLGLIQADEILRYWPVLLIGYGVTRLTGVFARRNLIVGSLFTFVGTWLMLENLDVVHYSIWVLWPIGLVLLGVTMVGGAMRRVRLARGVEGELGTGGAGAAAAASPGDHSDPSSTLTAFALWSGIDRKMTSSDFQGGDVTAIMGGHEIDLRSAKIASGPAVIDLLVLMGGVDLRVPEDWKISFEGMAIMGGVEDHTKAPAAEARGHLILRGLVMMGGVEVKN